MAQPWLIPAFRPPKADVELADIVGRSGPRYISQYGHRTTPSQKRALSDIAACCTEELGDGATAAMIAMIRSVDTTAAEIARAPNIDKDFCYPQSH